MFPVARNNQLKGQSTKSKHSIAAILLAAGRSERMGVFKPLLPFGNKTVVESCINYLSQGGASEIVVVIGHRADDLRRSLEGLAVTLALNPNPASEMSDSIRCGVKLLPVDTAAILVALVDQPAVPRTVVIQLIQEWMNGARIVIPTWQGRGGHPVLIDQRFRGELEELGSRRTLRSVIEAHSDAVTRIEVGTQYIARDIDTWDDYNALHQELTGKPAPATAED